LHGLNKFEWHVAWSNLGRYFMQFLDPHATDFPWPKIDLSDVRRLYREVADFVFQFLNISKHLPGRDFMDSSWAGYPVSSVHEDAAMFGPLFGYLGLAMLFFHLFRTGFTRETIQKKSLAFAALFFLILMASAVRWQSTSGRLLVPMAAVASPLMAHLYSVRKRWTAPAGNFMLAAVCLVYLLSSVLLNNMKPLVGDWTIWGKDRIQLITRCMPSYDRMIRFIDSVIPEGEQLAFVPASGDSPEYLFFGRRFQRKVFPVRMDKKELLSVGRLPAANYLLFEGERQEPFYLEDSNIPKTSFGFGSVDLRPLLAAVRDPGSGWHLVAEKDGFCHLFAREVDEYDLSLLPGSGNWRMWSDDWVTNDFVIEVLIDRAKTLVQIRGEVPDLGLQPAIKVEGPDNKTLAELRPETASWFECRIPLDSLLPAFEGRYVPLRFTSNLKFNPKKLGQSEDSRDLSWRLHEFILTSVDSIK
jgi:hypothetical protein